MAKSNSSTEFHLVWISILMSLLVGCTSPSAPTPYPTEMTATQEAALTLPYHEDFSDETSGWRVANKAYYRLAYQDGGYLMMIKGPNLLYTFRLRSADLEDMIIETNAVVIAGNPESGFGLICRFKEHGTLYLFQIRGTGRYRSGKYVNDRYLEITPWESSEAILQDGSINHLRAECVGESLSFYVNDTLLVQVQDIIIHNGGFGFVVEGADREDVTVLFDDFFASQP